MSVNKTLMTLSELRNLIKEEIDEPTAQARASTPVQQQPKATWDNSVLYNALKHGAPFVRITPSSGAIYDVSLKDGKVVIQKKTLQPENEPLIPNKPDELLNFEKHLKIEHGLDNTNSWIPEK